MGWPVTFTQAQSEALHEAVGRYLRSEDPNTETYTMVAIVKNQMDRGITLDEAEQDLLQWVVRSQLQHGRWEALEIVGFKLWNVWLRDPPYWKQDLKEKFRGQQLDRDDITGL